MVQAHDAAGDVAAGRVVVCAHQGPDTGIGTQDARFRKGRGQFGAFGDEERYLVRSNGHVVAFLEGDAGAGGANHTNRVTGHQNIGIGRLAAAVDNQVVHAVRKDEEGALGGEHAHFYTGQFRNVLAPDAAGIYRDGGVKVHFLTGLSATGVHTLDGVSFALADEPGDLRVQAHLAAVQFGVQHVGGAQAERVHTAVRHLHGSNQVRIYAGLQAFGQFRVYDFRAYPRLPAGVHKGLLVAQVILRQGDEQAVGLVYAVGGNPAQNHVLADAFLRAFCIVYSVARAGVQQAVVAARGPGGNVRAFNQEGPQAAHGAVPLGAGSRDAAADDNHIKFVGAHVCVLLILQIYPIFGRNQSIIGPVFLWKPSA